MFHYLIFQFAADDKEKKKIIGYFIPATVYHYSLTLQWDLQAFTQFFTP